MSKKTFKSAYENKADITKMAQEFSEPFYENFGSINNTGWLIVDPLAGYLGFCGWENKLHEMPDCEQHPQVLIITFEDGSQFIPAGADLKGIHEGFENWMWIP